MILSSVREVFDSACLLLRARAIALRPTILELLRLLVELIPAGRALDLWFFILLHVRKCSIFLQEGLVRQKRTPTQQTGENTEWGFFFCEGGRGMNSTPQKPIDFLPAGYFYSMLGTVSTRCFHPSPSMRKPKTCPSSSATSSEMSTHSP